MSPDGRDDVDTFANLAHQQLPRLELSVLQEAGHLQQGGAKHDRLLVLTTIWLASGQVHTAVWAMNKPHCVDSTGQLHKAATQQRNTLHCLARPAHWSAHWKQQIAVGHVGCQQLQHTHFVLLHVAGVCVAAAGCCASGHDSRMLTAAAQPSCTLDSKTAACRAALQQASVQLQGSAQRQLWDSHHKPLPAAAA